MNHTSLIVKVKKMKHNIMNKTLAFSLMCVVYVACLSQAAADTHSQPELKRLQTQWFEALNEPSTQQQRFIDLQAVVKKMVKLSLAQPQDAQVKAWSGIMLSAFAGVRKHNGDHIAFFAQSRLHQAQKLDGDVLDSRALSNGMRARDALILALTHNPSGVDIQRFYGAFLDTPTTHMLANLDSDTQETTNSTFKYTQAMN